MNKKAIITAGSRGIGAAIASSLKEIGIDSIATSKKDLDTSDLTSVKNFLSNNLETDILVLNTGGPPAIDFYNIKQRISN